METKQALTQLTEEIFGVVKEKVDDTNTDLTTHINNTNNPHQVTKAQVGLGNVDNTSDANKPISTATQTALNLKEDKSNKVTSFQSTPDNTHYPSEKLVKDNLDTKQTKANLVNAWQSTPDDTHYPSEKLVKDNLDTINSKIPSEASSTNQLADKQWVNDNGGKIDTASIDGDNLPVTNKNLEIPTVRTDVNNQGLTSTQKTNAKTNLDLNNVTNDQQVKGLASGTTEDNIVTFGNDGYSVKDSGKTFTTSIRDTSNATDTVIPTEKATRTALDLKVDKSDIGYLSISGQSGTFDAYEFSEISKKYCVIYKSDTREYFYKLSWPSNPIKYVFTNINISGGNTVSVSNKYIEVYPTYNPVQWMYFSSNYDIYSSSYVDTLLTNKVDKSDIGYIEINSNQGAVLLTNEQYAEAQKNYCVINYNNVCYYKYSETTDQISFISATRVNSPDVYYQIVEEYVYIKKSTKYCYLNLGNCVDVYDYTTVDSLLLEKLATNQVTTVETSTTASKTYVVGDLLIYNGTLYKVTSAISSGGTIIVGTNVVAITIEELLSDKQDKSNIRTSWQSTPDNIHYPSEKLVKDSLDNKSDKSATVSTVSYDATNKKLTKTINGTTTDVVSITTLKSDIDSLNDRYIRYDTNAQGLTTTQQTNSRTNINALGKSENSVSATQLSILFTKTSEVETATGYYKIATLTHTSWDYCSFTMLANESYADPKFNTIFDVRCADNANSLNSFAFHVIAGDDISNRLAYLSTVDGNGYVTKIEIYMLCERFHHPNFYLIATKPSSKMLSINTTNWGATPDKASGTTMTGNAENVIVASNSYKLGGVAASSYVKKVNNTTPDSNGNVTLTIPQGTVTSVGAGTGLSISGTASVNPTVNVASGYKLPTNTEWNGKQDTLTAGDGITIDSNNEISVTNPVDVMSQSEFDDATSGGQTASVNPIVDLIYPVGAVYISVNSTSPASLFGGTWEQLQNRFLLGAGSSYTAGNTGGEATHTLTYQEMPKHTHNVKTRYVTGTQGTEGPGGNLQVDVGWSNFNSRDGGNLTTSAGGDSNGNTVAHNNMPPYLVVYMWKRTA